MESKTFCFAVDGLKNVIVNNFGEMLAAKHISAGGVIVSTYSVTFVRDKIETEPNTVRMINFSLNRFGPQITAKHVFDGGLFTDDECDAIIAFLNKHVIQCGNNSGGRRTQRKQRRKQRKNTRSVRKQRATRKH